jgi:hypothetical protein
MAPGRPQEALELADAVFSGRVASVTRGGSGEFEALRVVFSVERVWKGPVASRLEVRTAPDSAACGFPFERGRAYVVYAYQGEGGLGASLCSRTNFVEVAGEDLAALGDGVVPPPQPSVSNPWLLGLGILLVVLGGWITIRNRLRRGRQRPGPGRPGDRPE